MKATHKKEVVKVIKEESYTLEVTLQELELIFVGIGKISSKKDGRILMDMFNEIRRVSENKLSYDKGLITRVKGQIILP